MGTRSRQMKKKMRDVEDLPDERSAANLLDLPIDDDED